MILLLSWKHGGMIHVSGILGLRIISFLEGISKMGGEEGAALDRGGRKLTWLSNLRTCW